MFLNRRKRKLQLVVFYISWVCIVVKNILALSCLWISSWIWRHRRQLFFQETHEKMCYSSFFYPYAPVTLDLIHTSSDNSLLHIKMSSIIRLLMWNACESHMQCNYDIYDMMTWSCTFRCWTNYKDKDIIWHIIRAFFSYISSCMTKYKYTMYTKLKCLFWNKQGTLSCTLELERNITMLKILPKK